MGDPRTASNWAILAAALGAACFGYHAAQSQAPEPEPELFIQNTWSDPAHCNLGRAQHVALDALVRDYRTLRGRCVAVRGFWLGSGLFLRAQDAGASEALYARNVAASWIGLYGRREIMDRTYARSRLQVTAVGTVGSCETLGDRTVNVMGYCHSIMEGPYLALAQMYLVSRVRRNVVAPPR